MQELMQDDLSLLALPLFLVALAAEAWWSYRKKLGWYEAGDAAASLAMMLFAGLVEIAPRLLALWLMFVLHEASPLRMWCSNSGGPGCCSFFWMISPTTGFIA